jgi:hypothetical protein
MIETLPRRHLRTETTNIVTVGMYVEGAHPGVGIADWGQVIGIRLAHWQQSVGIYLKGIL